ncbi:MAG: DNA-binding transcriptional regulator GbsR (MarR family) [Arenicella sp.]|jgi:DNA-binding transcriptional regulator GbsR (MarR family)
MELKEAQEKFIQAWGMLGSSWGINRTMAQIHALLLISTKPLSTEDIMKELQISRGNANMNTRALIDWGLVFKEYKSGERKEFFSAEKELWVIAKQVAAERRKRELEPLLRILKQIKTTEGKEDNKEWQEFAEVVDGIESFGNKADSLLEMVVKADENWLFSKILKTKTKKKGK